MIGAAASHARGFEHDFAHRLPVLDETGGLVDHGEVRLETEDFFVQSRSYPVITEITMISSATPSEQYVIGSR